MPDPSKYSSKTPAKPGVGQFIKGLFDPTAANDYRYGRIANRALEGKGGGTFTTKAPWTNPMNNQVVPKGRSVSLTPGGGGTLTTPSTPGIPASPGTQGYSKITEGAPMDTYIPSEVETGDPYYGKAVWNHRGQYDPAQAPANRAGWLTQGLQQAQAAQQPIANVTNPNDGLTRPYQAGFNLQVPDIKEEWVAGTPPVAGTPAVPGTSTPQDRYFNVSVGGPQAPGGNWQKTPSTDLDWINKGSIRSAGGKKKGYPVRNKSGRLSGGGFKKGGKLGDKDIDNMNRF